MSYIGRDLRTGAFRQLDDISSGFDGSTTGFTMQVNSGNVQLGDVNQILLSLGGVIQKPGTDFTISTSTLTFTTAPAANTSFFAILLGSDNGGTVTPTDGSVTGDKIASNLSIATNVTITTADNTDTLTLKSTDADAAEGPNLILQRDSGSPADGDDIARIDFDADNDAGEVTRFVTLRGNISDVSDGSEDGQFLMQQMIAGSEVNTMRVKPDEIVFNDSSIDLDFRVESNGSANMLFVDGGNDEVVIQKASSGATATSGSVLIVEDDDNTELSILGGSSSVLAINFGHSGDADDAIISYNTTSGSENMGFTVGSGEKMRLEAEFGALLVNKTTHGNTTGTVMNDANGVFTVVSGAAVFTANRLANDGIIVQLNQANSQEGNISVSGSTVSYNAFTGSHWSRLADNSKPKILRGTIMESLDTMMDWYQVRKDIPEVKYSAEDQEVKDGSKNVGDIKNKADTAVQSIALPEGKSVGDSMDFSFWGNDYTGTIVKEDDVKHTYCKISDTADSKKVYGLFHCWDDADDGLDGEVNDMEIAQVGTYIIRVNKDVTVEAGDLLVSNGDGTAKKQDDDIIRSKTVAKVNSNIKVETYSDGSYTVPCTLHC